jgi:NADH:ubiquinone oxidoreductase subunit 3 (subunit A)
MPYTTLYAYVGISMVIIVGFILVAFGIARLLAPSSKGSNQKGQTYETGESAVSDPWRPFPVRYYIFALMFLIFDVETAFLYPWAVVYGQLGLYAFIQMTIFVGIITLGLVYEWKKGALKWV